MGLDASQVIRRGNTFTILARVVAVNQNYITTGDWYSITREIWKKENGRAVRLQAPDEPLAYQILTADEDAHLPTSYGWDAESDPLGFNFLDTISGDFTNDGPTLFVIYRTVDGDGYPGIMEFQISTVEVP